MFSASASVTQLTEIRLISVLVRMTCLARELLKSALFLIGPSYPRLDVGARCRNFFSYGARRRKCTYTQWTFPIGMWMRVCGRPLVLLVALRGHAGSHAFLLLNNAPSIFTASSNAVSEASSKHRDALSMYQLLLIHCHIMEPPFRYTPDGVPWIS